MKKSIIKTLAILFIAILITGLIQNVCGSSEEIEKKPKIIENVISKEPKVEIKYTSLEVPNINSSFKTWMSYTAVTNKRSDQYKFINTYGWVDSEGFLRCNRDEDLGINEDYYLIALGSYYGTTIGTRYKITLDTGKVFYGILADCKDNLHTNSTNQYIPMNGNIVEFIVDTAKLNKTVKQMGNANYHTPLKGNIEKIEIINFVH